MDIDALFKTLALFTFIMLLFVVAYGDNGPFTVMKSIMCRLGRHKFHISHGGKPIPKYYCQNCKKPRKWPNLTLLDGGTIFDQYRYKKEDKDE